MTARGGWWLTGALLFLLLLASAGCATTSSAGTAQPVETDRVRAVKSYRWEPKVIRVPAGTTVTWRNDDNFSHSVRLLTGDRAPHLMQPGQSVSLTFDTPGEYPYECSLHPREMQGKVIVVPR
jgi:plastocyanin